MPDLVVAERLCIVLQLRSCEFESRPRVHSPSGDAHESSLLPYRILRHAAGDGCEEFGSSYKVFDCDPIMLLNRK